MRQFPLEYINRRPLRFYPQQPEQVAGDILEIGPGNGDFLLHLASEQSHAAIVALELDSFRFKQVQRRLKQNEVLNVLLIYGDARAVIPSYLRKCQFKQIYILFPDPWPKRRHEPKRLLTVGFLEFISTVLASDGELYVATDVRAYAEWVAENMAAVRALDIQGSPFSDKSSIPGYTTTFFEQVARRDQKPISYLIAKKRS